jgi:subtilisin family serine protease
VKKTISLTIALLAVYSASVSAATRPADADYVENQIIVKFCRPVTDKLEMRLTKGVSAGRLRLSASLDKLNKKYRLKKAKPLFKNFRKNRQHIKTLLKNDKTLLTKKEKHLLRRLSRTPKSAKIPELDRIYTLEVELEQGQSLEDVVAAYNSDPDVEYAELNYIVSINLTPNDPLYPIQWPLNNTGQIYPESGRYNTPPGTPDNDIDAPEAWDVHTGGSEIIVAVIDTGVDYTHRDIEDNMWLNPGEIPGNGIDDDGNGYIDDIYGYDFRNGDGDPKDDHGHGTHCGGIIAAQGDNGLDIAGLCWDAKVMALKFLGAGGSGNTIDAVIAFYYAVENGADVMSNSWGGGDYLQSLQDVISYAYSQGVIMVAAAGNDNSDDPHYYPAYYDYMIAVAATNSNDARALFSNYGDWVDIAAPGVDILSLRATGTSRGTTYDSYTTILSGTSMACPHVAGACALLFSIYPDIQVDELEQFLTEAADTIAPGICRSGRLNAHRAATNLVGPQGRIYLDSDFYSCSSLVEIMLFDSDLKLNSTQQVTISTDAGDFETILLTRQSSAQSIFDGTISTGPDSPNIEDGILQVSHGQIIIATYEDTNDGTGNTATATDTAIVDCVAPVISNVQVQIRGITATITFQTDEPTTGQLRCGFECGQTYPIVAKDLNLSTTPTILLELQSDTDYYFVVEANDAAGNRTADDNAGQCYQFTTSTPFILHVPAEYPTIQEAVDQAWDGYGETVLVADGIYTGHGNRDIDFRGKSITVKSENGPDNCIINCNASSTQPHRGFYFVSGETADSILDGFTITNGYVTRYAPAGQLGGGIYCNSSSPTIANCYITQNTAELGAGGGLCCENSDLIIRNCIISANRARGAGAIYCINKSNMTISNTVVSGNIGQTQSCGGIYIDYSRATVNNCTIVGNWANWYGGGIRCYYHATATVTNSILWANQAMLGGPQIALLDFSTVTASFSDINGGQPDVYTKNKCTVNWGKGNIDIEPSFADPGFWDGDLWIDGDYHLLEYSLCIDAGDPNYLLDPDETDIDGQTRLWDGRVDIGADEYIPLLEVPMKLTPQTLNPRSKGKWLKAHFVLPEGFAAEDVDIDTPALLEPLGIESDHINVFINKDGFVEIEAAFSRTDFCGTLTGNEPVEVTVTGRLTTGQQFYGTDTIRITNNYLEQLAVLSSHWLRTDCGRPDWCDGADLNADSVVNFLDFALLDGCCIEVIKH